MEAFLASLFDAQSSHWAQLDTRLREPYEILGGFLASGGKRIRPVLCYYGYKAAGGDPESSLVLEAGAALELYHAAALVHDDVIDASGTRRGHESIHCQQTRRHQLAALKGEPRRYGEGIAILVGDLAMAEAEGLLVGAPSAARSVFRELRREVTLGQYLDLSATAAGLADRGTARTIALYKSAYYSVERPLALGVALAGRIDDLGPGLAAFGLPLGEAFQLRDDLLGTFGDPTQTGKPDGDDIRQGKITMLYATAIEMASPSKRRLLTDRLGAASLTPAEIAELKCIIQDTGARQQIENRISELLDESLAALDKLDIAEEDRRELAIMADFIVNRDR